MTDLCSRRAGLRWVGGPTLKSLEREREDMEVTKTFSL